MIWSNFVKKVTVYAKCTDTGQEAIEMFSTCVLISKYVIDQQCTYIVRQNDEW